MGILRADRITGLGGANAIKGSVYFPYVASGSYSHQYQEIQSDDYAFGTGAFTLECWYYMDGDGGHTDSVGNIILLTGTNTLQSPSNNGVWLASRNDNKFEARVYYVSGSWNMTMTSTNAFARNTWYHLAMVRSGSSVKLYVNGVQEASGSNSSDLNTTVSTSLYIGAQGNLTSTGSLGSRGITGYVSNVRVSNEALYTAAFTPPVGELQKLSSTITLCNQSASNVLKEETGKTISLYRKTLNHQLPLATKFTPNSPVGFSTTTDVGSQYGTTFDGFGSFSTSTYMVPPGGNTRERNRGRALWMGGYAPSQYRTMIDFVNIQSLGNAQHFGELGSTSTGEGSECSSSTRAIQGGGSLVNTMEFVTIANESNITNFGDLTVPRRSLDALSNDTRGIWAGGTTNPAMSDVIDFVTIATAGDAADFGNLTVGRRNMGTAASPTRGVFAGGNPGSSPLLDDTMDYITIASAGDAIDFGNLSAAYREGGGCSNGTRGVFAVGGPGSGSLNTMEFVTIASTGDTTDYGDLFYAAGNLGGTSNGTRGVFGGGAGAAYTNIIQYITIATTGNAADFGDLTFTRIPYGATSDSHGGLS